MNLLSIFRRKPAPVIVQTFKTKKTDLERIRAEKTEQLRREVALRSHDQFAEKFSAALREVQ